MLSIQEDVIRGLSQTPKRISSRWFYDTKGDKLFQEIMELPEYYLTRAEFKVLKENAAEIFSVFQDNEAINIVELGAGDGKKTRVLFDYLNAKERDFQYVPIDISQNALNKLESALQIEYPSLDILCLQTDYFTALKSEALSGHGRKLVLFLGSNVGNLLEHEAVAFFKEMNEALKPGDAVLIGLDRVKDPEVILAAYNDAAGVTRNFNMNLLSRLNDELGADFEIGQWQHEPRYDQERKAALSFIKSLKKQKVTFRDSGKSFSFEEGELIHTEISRKFTDEDIKALASESGFKLLMNLNHEQPLYTDSLWMKA